ncbi:MAG: trehalose-phosphatase [Rubrivivax sp.]
MPILPALDSDGALFFDFDGTLVDLAARPEDVCVPPGLAADLQAMQRRCGGALAVISGRPVDQIDGQLAPARLPVAGVHGSERRDAAGRWHRAPLPSLEAARAVLEAFCVTRPALRLELKPGALALHYRGADDLADACAAAMQQALGSTHGTVLLHGKKVIELKAAAVDKGRAVLAFMAESPFVSRRPWCFGDDVTDEAAFAAVLARGGVAVKVGDGDSIAPWRLSAPASLREWVHHQAHAGAPA